MEYCGRFTGAEGGARLASAAHSRNILAADHTAFIATTLLHEDAFKIRGSLSEGSQRSIYVTRASRVKLVAYDLTILTDLSVSSAVDYDDVQDWCAEVETKGILVCTSRVVKHMFEERVLSMNNVNVLVLDSCHLISRDDNLKYIMKLYKECQESKRPRILALTYPLFSQNRNDKLENVSKGDVNHEINSETANALENINDKSDDNELKHETNDNDIAQDNTDVVRSTKSNETMYDKYKNRDDKDVHNDIGVYENHDNFDMYEKLEWKIDTLENELCCQADFAEDIDNVKRLSSIISKPKELVVEYSTETDKGGLTSSCVELERSMRDIVNDALNFLNDHRYDPTEIYGEDMYEELKGIPDPTLEPKQIFKDFIYILDQLGPYGADKAAFSLLTKLEKLKVKVPYERHFLILCLCTTIFIKIRCAADSVFAQYENDWEKIKYFSTPKVVRFSEILEQFKPPNDDDDDVKNNKVIPNSGNDAENDNDTSKVVSNSGNTAGNHNDTSKVIPNSGNDAENDNNTSKVVSRSGNTAGNRNDTSKVISNSGNDAENDNDSSKVISNSGNTAGNYNDTSKIISTKESKSAESYTTQIAKLDTEKIISELDKCNFIALSDKIEDRVNVYESNLQEIHEDKSAFVKDKSEVKNRTANRDICVEVRHEGKKDSHEMNSVRSAGPGVTRRSGHRIRGRGRLVRSNAARLQQMQANPDALCGIVYIKEPLMAKILFMVVVDLSRHNPNLKFLCAQYNAIDKPADPVKEQKEYEHQRKKQEEVLKKFRMHECNLMLATSALEEGIDLPRCNLVLRWDVPPSYRSYCLCRSRARATRSSCVLLSRAMDHNTDNILHNVATYKELDQIISRKCGCGIQNEPSQSEEDHADSFTAVVKPYSPLQTYTSENHDNKLRTDIDNHKNDIVNRINDTDSHKNDIDRKNGIDNQNSDIDNLKSDIDDQKNDIDNQRNDIDNQKSDIDNRINDTDNQKNDIDRKSDIDNQKTDIDKQKSDIDNQRNDIDKKCDVANSSIAICNKCHNNSVVTECVCRSGDRGKSCVNDSVASVDLSTSIALINRYCGKLPSDTFTRLAPQWWMEEVDLAVRSRPGERRKAYICTLRLPLNCPVKYNIVGHPMPTQALARRMVALQACRILHKSGELDNQLMPIGKENFKAPESVTIPLVTENQNNSSSDPNDLARPGTTKRRQYYYKRTAWAFTDCQPIIDTEDAELTGIPTQPTNQSNHNTTGSPNVGIASSTEGRPAGKRNMLYSIACRLWCALPERYNTRGRRLHAPQHARQALGILIARTELENLQIPAFPVYTRSGEVRVSVEPVAGADVRVSPRRGRLVRRFMRFVFAEVLRVRRRGMKLQSEGSTHNNYYIVPTIKTLKEDGSTKIDIDWAFLELIYQHTEEKKLSEIEKPILWHQDEEEEEDLKMELGKEKNISNKNDSDIAKVVNPAENCNEIDNNSLKTGNIDDTNEANVKTNEEILVEKNGVYRNRNDKGERVPKEMDNPLLKAGETFIFDPDLYREAVVTPWYRNQDQPQFFLVAEICGGLSPESAFPSEAHTTFRSYYTRKYGVRLTQREQPLLDVDHTSARLNLLTPRYVNRKGVALPVSSERTRRAKRDRLDQKQILVPELCRVHPFAAPLWFATVALPCVLYRINALLIADEIRRCVAIDVGLGIPKITESSSPGFEWPPLDFGWSLAEVLNVDYDKVEKRKEDIAEDGAEDVEKEGAGDSEEVAKEEGLEIEKKKTLNDILQEKEDAESGFEIGTWSNEMASSIPLSTEYDEFMEPLPSNLTFCTSVSGGTNWCDPVQRPRNNFQPTRCYSVVDSDCSYMSSSDFDTDDSDLNSERSEDDTDHNGFCSSKNSNAAMGVRIEYKTAHEAEAVDVRREKVSSAPQPDPEDDSEDRRLQEAYFNTGRAPTEYIEKFRNTVNEHKKDILENNLLITEREVIKDLLPEVRTHYDRASIERNADESKENKLLEEVFPYDAGVDVTCNGQVSLETIEDSKRRLLSKLKASLTEDDIAGLNCFSMRDVNIDSPDYLNDKLVNIGFDSKEMYVDKLNCVNEPAVKEKGTCDQASRMHNKKNEFDFDYQPKLEGHPGPSPSVILQALTMSNANDGINLERLETIGDSFLKFAITAYLYCAHPTVHEGKLSHMRSKQVSNLSLYRLGRNKRLGARMIASKFEPHDNWLPPCHKPPPTLGPKTAKESRIDHTYHCPVHGPYKSSYIHERCTCYMDGVADSTGCFIPYNLITQHSIPDKSIADCVEALIGAYLIECGPRGALLFMSWLGIQVLPRHDVPLQATHPYLRAEEDRRSATRQKKPPPPPERKEDASDSESEWSDSGGGSGQGAAGAGAGDRGGEDCGEGEDWSWPGRCVGSLRPYRDGSGQWMQPVFGELKAPPSPLLRYIQDPEGELERMLSGYEALERTLQYRFKDRSLLLQALTHASHQQNRLTDCYQRLEFLGDAILDYLITRYLYEDGRRHSPGALTDLRSALVNNTIFATLAVRHGFHKYFRHMSPGLNEVLMKYVKIQEENGHSISEEHYLIQEDEMEQAEDVEVPKALGDLFESVAGAIFLDSDMSLGAVWKSYVNLMGAELEAFSAAAPKSPVRELLEAEPDTAKFGKPERLADGRRVRVCVEVFGRGTFKGVGRNYRIAKGTAARCALRHLKRAHRA